MRSVTRPQRRGYGIGAKDPDPKDFRGLSAHPTPNVARAKSEIYRLCPCFLGSCGRLTDDECQLIYCKLPAKIESKQKVFLVDPIVGTGETALMAVRVLLDHSVQEERIVFLSLTSSADGLRTLGYCYPKIQIITSDLEGDVDALDQLDKLAEEDSHGHECMFEPEEDESPNWQ